MPYYGYRGLSQTKRSLTGQVWALDEAHARRQLEDRGLSKLFIKPPPPWSAFLERLRPATAQDHALCCRQLAMLLKGGVSISNSLDVLLRQPLPPGLYKAYANCSMAVQQGSSLSNAMRKCKGEFDEFYVGLVQVGEQTGRLPQNVMDVSDYLEREMELRAKVRGALTYPLIVTSLSLCMAYLMVQHILPRFINGLFPEGMALPWFTSALIGITRLFQRPSLVALALGLLATLFLMMRSYLSTEAGRLQLYEALMKWKPTRNFFGKILAVRTARTLATGVEAGLTISASLKLASSASGNPYLSRYLDIACEDLTDGNPLSRCFRAIPFAPPMLCGFIELGEETSGLPKVLRKSAEMLELEVDEVIQTFTQLLEPVLVGMMGFFVGFVLIALFIPIYQMLGSV
ncbi:type II secretion system F family protein [bacterium]|nr:type II secretion system F family protein [bacterium]